MEPQFYKFSDIMEHWARETLEHEVVVGRRLADGFIKDGLQIQSSGAMGIDSSAELRGYPYIGYVAQKGMPARVIRAQALEHLLAVMNHAIDPSKPLLNEEFIERSDFQQWCIATGRAMPDFWT